MTDKATARAHTITGDLREHTLESEHLGGPRTFVVWLPPGYANDDVTRYPVLYLHDGQNLFDRATAFADEWQVDETATKLILRGDIAPVIIVGVYNAGDARVDEYTPVADAKLGRGGRLALHGRMLIEELKPLVDASYRTLPGAANTALGGSSLGGLATLELGLRYYTAISMLAVLSPAVWWGDRAVLTSVQALPSRPPLRIWLDAGTAESASVIPDTRALRDALVQKGWRVGEDLAYSEVRGAVHDERAWAARIGPMLRYFFGTPRRPLGRTLGALRRLRDRWTGPRP